MLKRTLPDERISHAVESAGRAAEIASRAAEELKVENIFQLNFERFQCNLIRFDKTVLK